MGRFRLTRIPHAAMSYLCLLGSDDKWQVTMRVWRVTASHNNGVASHGESQQGHGEYGESQ